MRPATCLLLVCVAVGCSEPTGDANEDPGVWAAGTYVLVQVNGQPLPITYVKGPWDYGDGVLELVGAVTTLRRDQTYSLVWLYRETTGEAVRDFGREIVGTYGGDGGFGLRFGAPSGSACCMSTATIRSNELSWQFNDTDILTFTR